MIGASMGGLEALRNLVGGLPRGLDASVFIVRHTAPSAPNLLDRILADAGSLPAATAGHWQAFQRGHIYVAPADHHLLLDRAGFMQLSRGPRENRFRPSVDVLFRSAAYSFGPRVIGIVLSGWLDDGTAGLWAIKSRGGVAIVQEPQDAIAPGMPRSALKHVAVDHCVAARDIADIIVRLSGEAVDERGAQPVSPLMSTEVKIAQEQSAFESDIAELGEPSFYTCPECQGVLLQIEDGSGIRFRCHTGHAYSLEALLSDLGEQNEHALWAGVRSLQETVALLRHMASALEDHQHTDDASTLRRKAEETEARAKAIREVIMQRSDPVKAPLTTEAAASVDTASAFDDIPSKA